MEQERFTSNRDFGAIYHGALAILVYPDTWAPEAFQEWLDILVNAFNKQVAAGFIPTSLLVFAVGQTLSAKERRDLVTRLPPPKNAPPMRQALLTNSAIYRGALKAVSWLSPKPDYQMRAFPTNKASAAIEWLQGTAKFDPEKARASLHYLVRETGGNPALIG